MNWGLGLFRIWLLFSVVWITLCTIYGFQEWKESNRRAVYDVTDPNGVKFRVTSPVGVSEEKVMTFIKESDEVQKRQIECAAKPGPWCNYSQAVEMPAPRANLWPAIAAALLVPSITLVIGFAFRWVLAGFNTPRPRAR